MKGDFRFKSARLEAGITQRELALILGIPEHVISKIETGRVRPPRELAAQLGAILGRHPFELGI